MAAGDAVLSEEGRDDPARLDADAGLDRRSRSTAPASSASRPGTDWAVHVALVIDGAPVAGAVALPALDADASPPTLLPRHPPHAAARPG